MMKDLWIFGFVDHFYNRELHRTTIRKLSNSKPFSSRESKGSEELGIRKIMKIRWHSKIMVWRKGKRTTLT